MATQDQITRLSTARNTIRTKLVALGLAESTAKLDTLATAVEGIKNNGGVSATVKEGETYQIPEGYHNGSGTVSGVAGGGNYELQSKTVTPTKQQQSVTPDAGKFGLSDVLVNAIPENYQDVASVTATAADVLATKVIVEADGTVTAGTMPNIGAVSETLSIGTESYTVSKGYHNGTGTVKIVKETKSATPTKSSQTISASTGKVLSSVTVAAIPAEYITTSDATAVAADILTNKTAYVDGVKVTGSMKNNGAVTASIDGLTTTSYTIPAGYHSGTGKVSLTSDIETALAAI